MSFRLDAMIENVVRELPIGVGLADRAGGVRYLNPAALAELGLESLHNESDRERALALLDREQRAEKPGPLTRGLEGQRIRDEEIRVRDSAAGVERILLVRVEPLQGVAAPMIVFTLQDISSRAEAGEAVTRAHALIEGITAGTDDLIAAEDTDYRYTFFNAAYRREVKKLWGRDIEVGTSMLDMLSAWPEELDKARQLWRRALEGENFSVTMEFGPTREARQVYDLRFNPIYDSQGRLIGAAHILRNVSDRVRTLEALEQSEAALRQADERKDEFLATLAHELRNPLAPIQSGIEILRSDAGNLRALDMMQRQMTQLVRLVDDLLDISRISRGRIVLRKEPVDLAAVIDHALESSRAAFDHGKRIVTVDLPSDLPKVDADAVRLVQIVANLVNNAVKFSRDDGRIDIAAHAAGELVAIAVSDDGVGIASERLGQIFELFEQGDATDTSGLGIGLTLVRNLVELHGGHVEASSAGPGQGSVFTVSVPASEHGPSVETGNDRDAWRTPLHGRRVLIVDDNEDAALALEVLLREQGAETQCAFDGTAALERFAVFEPDAAILDIGMPELDGCEVARRIRLLPDFADVCLVALTGWSQSDDVARILEAGFDHHVAKPVRIESLVELLTAER